MTVATTATDVIYIEDGSTVQFDFNTFTIFEQTDIVVTSIVIATGLGNPNYDGGGVAGELVLNTDYTVTINADGTGYITKTIALSNAFELVIQRVLPITQGISLVDNEGTDASTFEEGYDRLTMIAQQLQAQINRTVLLPVTQGTPIAFPTPVASTYLGFDANSNLTTLTSVSTVTLTPISPSVAGYMAQVNAGGTNLQYVTLASLLAALTAANLISGKILFQLANIPAGAGVIPIANLPTGTTSGQILVANSNNAPPVYYPYVKCSLTMSSGTGGGSSTSGSWLTYPLNTKDNDTASIATLNGSGGSPAYGIVLPAGTYRVVAKAAFYGGGGSGVYGQIRLYNSTGSAILVNGIGSNATANSSAPISELSGVFTLAGTTSLLMQYQVNNSEATDGLGLSVGYGAEVYGVIEFEKIG